MSPRSAAFVIPGDINTVTGGYIYDRKLLEGLRALGHDVTHVALSASFPNPSPGDMAAALAQLNAIAPSRALILDGLVFGSIDTAGLAALTAPLVAMIHHPLALETGLAPAWRDHLFHTERDNLALAAHVLVPSPHTAHILITDYGIAPDRITVARPGNDRPTGLRNPVDPPVILSVGIQSARKGHDTLLRALAQITQLDWRAVIVGAAHDLGYAKGLAALVESLGLGYRVRLTGQIPEEALQTLYAEARIFALATRYEGYGMVFDEALKWGLPIVSCDTGAVSDTVPVQAGLLVPPDAPADFAAALARILSDTSLQDRLARAARTAGLALPRWQDTAQIAGRVLNDL